MVGAATEAVALLVGVFEAAAPLPSPPSKTSHSPVMASQVPTLLPVEGAAAAPVVVMEMMVVELGCFQWNLKLKVPCWILPLLAHPEQNLTSLLLVVGVRLFPIPAFGISLGIHFSP